MSVTRIATRYSTSLLDLAVEQNKLDRVLTDVRLLLNSLENRELVLLVKSPIIHATKKISVLEAVFQDKMDELTMSFLTLITKKGREGYIQEIAESFIEQYRTYRNIIAVKVTSAVALSDEKLEAIRKKIAASPEFGGTIEIKAEVDPSIIGGLIIEIGDKQYDASVAHQLDKLKKSFQA